MCNNLAIGLATFSICQDVIMSFLCLAEQNVLSNQWECTLARQKVFALYALYTEEQASFEQWHKRVPVVTWIYDDMVLNHVGSHFHHIQESMFEIFVHRKLLKMCSPTSACLSASESCKADIEEKLICLLCVIHSVAAEVKISEHLCTNLCIALAVYKCLRVTFQWMWSVAVGAVSTPSGINSLRIASRCLSTQARKIVSCHLDPFLFPVPDVTTNWQDFVQVRLLEDGRESLFTWWQNSRFWADRCYSLLFFYLHHMVTYEKGDLNLCDKTIELYEECSPNRHHCIPVLRLLCKYLRPLPAPDHVWTPYALGMTKGRVVEDCPLFGRQEEGLLRHLLTREPVLGPRIMDFGRAATRFHSTF